ncbi:MAG: AraC family transcriptional regulator [Clostridia bacterium]|nr:AraC family transcriptional regulator [Clostridia bacterium]
MSLLLKNNCDLQDSIATNDLHFGISLAKNPLLLDANAYNFFRHTSEKHQILIFLSGDCRMDTDNYSHVLQPGDVCFNPALSYYGVTILSDAPYERVVAAIKPSPRFDKLAFEVFSDLKPINVNVKEQLLPFIERFKFYSEKLPLKQFSEFSQFLLEEFLCICQIAKNSANNIVDTSDNLLKSALKYIDANWSTIKNVQDISNALFISPSYLYEIFNKALGIAPKTYLTQKRLQEAHAYLISGFSPNETSRLVGFNTYTAFYRACKAFYGKSPQDIWVKKN